MCLPMYRVSRCAQRARSRNAKDRHQEDKQKEFLDFLETLNSSDSPVPPGAPEELQRTILREAHDALYNDKWNVCAGRLSLFLSLIMSLIISLSLSLSLSLSDHSDLLRLSLS